MFDYNKLRGRIREILGTEEKYGEAIGLSKTSISKRLNGEIAFDAIDIHKSIEILKIPENEITTYFFSKKV